MWGIQYIQREAEHHRKIIFQEEFLALLRKHGIALAPAAVLCGTSLPFITFLSELDLSCPSSSIVPG
jgi:hypothetical protein